MKRVVILVVAAMMMAACGGSGSGSKSGGGKKYVPKSGLKKNAYLGNLPGIFADYSMAEQAINDYVYGRIKSDELKKRLGVLGNDASEIMKMGVLSSEVTPMMWYNLTNTLSNELINLKSIPFTVSSAFAEMYPKIEISDVRLCLKLPYLDIGLANVQFEPHIVAKEDLEVNNQDNKYRILYARFVISNGVTIEVGGAFFFEERKYTKGESTDNCVVSITQSLYNNPNRWVDFAKIEFITPEEFEKYEQQVK